MLAQDLYDLAKTIQPGDIVLETRRMKHFHTREWITEARSFKVSGVETTHERVAIMYRPCRRPDSVQCGHGVSFIKPVENGNHSHEKWGMQTLEVVGKEGTVMATPGFGWMVRHPGYDLMY